MLWKNGKDGGFRYFPDTCEQTSRSNRLRTDIREISQAASNVRKSLQTCGLVNNKEVFEGHIQRLERKWNSDSLSSDSGEWIIWELEILQAVKHMSQDLRDLFGPREAQPIDVARRGKWNWVRVKLSVSHLKAVKAWNFASTCHKIWEICLVLDWRNSAYRCEYPDFANALFFMYLNTNITSNNFMLNFSSPKLVDTKHKFKMACFNFEHLYQIAVDTRLIFYSGKNL